MFRLLLIQSLTLAFRKGGGALGTMAFYVIIVTLFNFALGPDGMRAHAGAVMCVSLLLATVISLPLLFERDFEDGTLEQLLLLPAMLEILVLARICGQWLAHILPILLITLLLGIMTNLSLDDSLHVMSILFLASPTIVALGAIGAALTIGARRGGLLQALIVMPLYIPVLIFASSAAGQGAIWFLGGMLCASLPIACFVSSALIRVSQD